MGHVPRAEAIDLLHHCGLIGRVEAYFRAADGHDLWHYFPNMGRAPESEGVSGQFVAVYDGPVSGLFTGRGDPEPPTDVLCVIGPTTGPNVYANVSREGMVLPPGAFVAAPDEWILPTPPAT